MLDCLSDDSKLAGYKIISLVISRSVEKDIATPKDHFQERQNFKCSLRIAQINLTNIN